LCYVRGAELPPTHPGRSLGGDQPHEALFGECEDYTIIEGKRQRPTFRDDGRKLLGVMHPSSTLPKGPAGNLVKIRIGHVAKGKIGQVGDALGRILWYTGTGGDAWQSAEEGRSSTCSKASGSWRG
jgi:hypothetical protein